ncbi:hypothetical protein QQF64_035574 [Cirrhinus molitorella]|uniref:Uncharacterized protein n=1 Tax=Cirrhinus molitorella TaxID=172907 RepID=A0ABR3NG68_9TELE
MATRIDQTATSDGDESCSAVRRGDVPHTGLGICLSSTCHQTMAAILMAYCSENYASPMNAIERRRD